MLVITMHVRNNLNSNSKGLDKKTLLSIYTSKPLKVVF